MLLCDSHTLVMAGSETVEADEAARKAQAIQTAMEAASGFNINGNS